MIKKTVTTLFLIILPLISVLGLLNLSMVNYNVVHSCFAAMMTGEMCPDAYSVAMAIHQSSGVQAFFQFVVQVLLFISVIVRLYLVDFSLKQNNFQQETLYSYKKFSDSVFNIFQKFFDWLIVFYKRDPSEILA